jgi:benzodiazapine receptor
MIRIKNYKPMKSLDYIVLTISLITPQAVGLLGALSTLTGLSTWYQELSKPFFNPPSWIFGPVWSILYIFIGLVFYFIYKEISISKTEKKLLISLFIIQLVLNGIWTPIFFGAQNLFLAMIVIVSMDIFLITMLVYFKKLKLNLITTLWIPYVLWVLFATLLNITLWAMNN